MSVRLSTKGQLVIPKEIRDALGLRAGDRFNIRIENHNTLVLEPIRESGAEALYGKFAGEDLLTALETEHREELNRE
jgi:AbrB family looped-hinge helix DNA binding protein